jgi:hypothetical protein
MYEQLAKPPWQAGMMINYRAVPKAPPRRGVSRQLTHVEIEE